MVNDNQIVNETKIKTRQATALFIKDDVTHNAPPVLYDLDQEFANTKKNKNMVTIISLIIFTVMFLAAAFGVTKYIEIQNSKIPISINAFEDVNLREIFDKAKQYEKDMQNAVRDLDDIYINRDSTIDQLKRNAANAISLIETENPNNKNIQINKIEEELKVHIEQEEELWQAEIIKVKARIDDIQSKIDSYDTRILEKAKEQEGIINNQQKRFDIEMEKTVSYYENKMKSMTEEHALQLKNMDLSNKDIIEKIKSNNIKLITSLEEKYNPIFTEDFKYITEVTQESEDRLESIDLLKNNIPDIIFSENIIDSEIPDMLLEQFQNAENTILRLKDIPYYNSPKEAIDYIQQVLLFSAKEYATVIDSITPVLLAKNSDIENKNIELEQLNYFLNTYIKANRINGIIVDPRSNYIKVFMDPIYQIEDGSIGLVFRNDSDFIGTIRFIYKNGILVAKILELSNKERGLNPFDMILINLN